MPRERSPNRDQAYEIYKQHGGNIENRRIAEILQISEKTVGGWKCKDRWEDKLNGVLQTNKRSTPKERGGQPRNRNAASHGAPEQNKNALKTGEFETLFFDTLDPEELRLAKMVQADKEQLLLQEIQLLTIRERRMLKRIEDIRGTVEQMDSGEEIAGMTLVKYQSGIEKGKDTELKEYQDKLGQIQSIEDALTRVQGRKQAAIDSLHRFGIDDAKMKLELMKLELEMSKRDQGSTETADDGFMDAMNEEAREWSEEDE